MTFRSLTRCAILGWLTFTGGCGLVVALIAIPLRIVSNILSIGVGIRIGADELRSFEDEIKASGVRIDRHDVDLWLRDDSTFEATIETERTVTGTAGIGLAQSASITFNPATQRVELLAAEVRTPDGNVVACDPRDCIERPSEATSDAPGFVSTHTKTVLLPQLSVGSRSVVRWRFVETARSILGFNYGYRPSFALPVERARITIHHPAALTLHHGERGGFSVSARADGGTSVLEAVLEKFPGWTPERAMVAPRDVVPLFVVSTLESRERLGTLFHEAMSRATAVTPTLEEAAERIAQTRTGIEAARAIHRHVATQVNYLAVHLDEASAWQPDPAEDVLRAGYGDCKNQVALLIALLAARDIEAHAVLVDRQLSFEPLPIATPFEYDHCIAYLPEFDLYCDPTDPWRELGELDLALLDKQVVHATAQGKVTRTPAAHPDSNRCVATHHATVGDDGRIRGTSRLELRGRPAARMRHALAEAGRANRVADDLLFATPEGGTGTLATSDPNDLSRPLVCEGAFDAEARVAMGETLAVPVPTGIDLVTPQRIRGFLTEGDRRFPLVASACRFEWTIEVTLPASHHAETLPSPVDVANDAGRYTSRAERRGDHVVVVTRSLRIEKDRYAPGETPRLQALLRALLADHHALILARANTP